MPVQKDTTPRPKTQLRKRQKGAGTDQTDLNRKTRFDKKFTTLAKRKSQCPENKL
jgi:hypothetical protein